MWQRPMLVSSSLLALKWGLICQYQVYHWARDAVEHGPGITADLLPSQLHDLISADKPSVFLLNALFNPKDEARS